MVGMWLSSPMAGSSEFSLVLFTVLTQMAMGAMVFLLFTRLTSKEPMASADAVTLTRQVVYVALAVSVVGILISLIHLGHPMRTYRALFYHLSTWMGKEVLFGGLFTLTLFVYAVLLLKGSGPRLGLEVFASITGVLAVLSSSLLYAVLGSVPSWNNIFTVIFFFLTFLLLGGSLFAAVIVMKLKSSADGVRDLAEKYLKTFASVFTPLIAVAIALVVAYLFYLGAGGPEAKKTFAAMTGSIFFWVRIVAGLVVPLLLIIGLKGVLSRGEALTKSFSYVIGVLGLLFVGEILGRMLFFATSVMHTLGGTGTPY